MLSVVGRGVGSGEGGGREKGMQPVVTVRGAWPALQMQWHGPCTRAPQPVCPSCIRPPFHDGIQAKAQVETEVEEAIAIREKEKVSSEVKSHVRCGARPDDSRASGGERCG